MKRNLQYHFKVKRSTINKAVFKLHVELAISQK